MELGKVIIVEIRHDGWVDSLFQMSDETDPTQKSLTILIHKMLS
jgi:hypothetical protein